MSGQFPHISSHVCFLQMLSSSGKASLAFKQTRCIDGSMFQNGTCRSDRLLALASCNFPAWLRGRSREAWRTKNTSKREAKRWVRAAPTEPLFCGLAAGLNLLKYSTLQQQSIP